MTAVADMYERYEKQLANDDDAPTKATAVEGWGVRKGKWTCELARLDDQGQLPAKPTGASWAPISLELLRLVRDVETQRIVGADVRVATAKGTATVYLPGQAASAREAAGIWASKAAHLAPEHARAAAKWLSMAINATDAPERLTLSHATWIGDRLHLPADCRPNPSAEENAAYDDWREIISTIYNNGLGSAALAIGANVNSVQIQRQGLPNSVTELEGDSSTGKTTSSRIGAAVWEAPPDAGAEPSWSTTIKALTKRLEDRSPLPFLLDDTGTVEDSDPAKFLAEAVMIIAQGRPRERLTQAAELQEQGEWRLNVVSTGETPILSGARVGASARAIELGGPFMPSAVVADRLWELAQRSYGWPGRWLTTADWPTPNPPALTARTNVGKRLARLVAGHAAGFIELGRIVGFDVAEFATAAAQSAVDAAEDRLEERGESSHERFWNALLHDVASNPALWPSYDNLIDRATQPDAILRGAAGRELRGVREDGRIYAFKPTVQRIATDAQVSQSDVLKKLKAEDKLIVLTKTRGLVERKSINGVPTECYVFEDLSEQAAEVASGMSSAAVPT